LASEKGLVGSLKVDGRLVRVQSAGEAIIVGDLHGDLESLVHILKASAFMEKASQGTGMLLIFLGDYGDRGAYSAEVYYIVLRLKQLFPQNVILMRGNHEGPEDLLAEPHDLPESLRERFAEEGSRVYEKLRGLFDSLFTAVIVEKLCLLVHGGAPRDATLEGLAYAHQTHPKTTMLEEILWSDPSDDIRGTCSSPRGAGRLFGEDVTQKLLDKLDVKVLVRGHEPTPEGFKINQHGKVLTLFSRKGPPYFNTSAAYLQLDLTLKLGNASDFLPFIHKF
jgi:protein phosphatase